MYEWATGNGFYYTLVQCLHNDIQMVVAVAVLCALTIVGYLKIAYDFWNHGKDFPKDSPSYKALRKMVWIFVCCSLCGYGFILIKIWFPVWGFYVAAMIALNIVTWSYIFSQSGVRQIADAIVDRQKMAEEIIHLTNLVAKLEDKKRKN